MNTEQKQEQIDKFVRELFSGLRHISTDKILLENDKIMYHPDEKNNHPFDELLPNFVKLLNEYLDSDNPSKEIISSIYKMILVLYINRIDSFQDHPETKLYFTISELEFRIESLQKENMVLAEKIHDYQELLISKNMPVDAIK